MSIVPAYHATAGRGSVRVKGVREWVALTPGAAGETIISAGPGADVYWGTPAVSADLTATVILAPNSANRNVIQPTADVNMGLEVARHSATQSAAIFRATDENGVPFFDVAGTGHIGMGTPALGPWQTAFGTTSASLVSALVFGTAGQTADLMQWSDINGIVGLGVDASQNLYISRNSTVQNRRQASFLGSFTDNADATYKSRLVVNVHDAGAARVVITGEADGAAARVGFLGATAAARQLLATGAGHTVDDVIAVLQTFGLCKQS